MILFLGSGVSLASGLPSVIDIGKELLRDNENPRVTKLFKVLINLDTDYLTVSAPFKHNDNTYGYTGQIFRSLTTYEDMFYLLNLIIINGEGRQADLSAQSLTDLVLLNSNGFLKGSTSVEKTLDLWKLAEEARRTIENTVFRMLHSEKVRGLDLILALAKSPNIRELNIVTLNHDTLVEQLLQNENIEYSDGFGKADGDVHWFEDNITKKNKVRVIKLHGSINWWNQGRSKVLKSSDIYINNPKKWKNSKGNPIINISRAPAFLTGVNKAYYYNRSIFTDQHFYFQSILRNEKLMIMSGYGWGDIPINFELQNWMLRNSNTKLVLLYKNPQALADGSLELTEIYNGYKKEKRINVIEKYLSETTLDNLLEFI